VPFESEQQFLIRKLSQQKDSDGSLDMKSRSKINPRVSNRGVIADIDALNHDDYKVDKEIKLT